MPVVPFPHASMDGYAHRYVEETADMSDDQAEKYFAQKCDEMEQSLRATGLSDIEIGLQLGDFAVALGEAYRNQAIMED